MFRIIFCPEWEKSFECPKDRDRMKQQIIKDIPFNRKTLYSSEDLAGQVVSRLNRVFQGPVFTVE